MCEVGFKAQAPICAHSQLAPWFNIICLSISLFFIAPNGTIEQHALIHCLSARTPPLMLGVSACQHEACCDIWSMMGAWSTTAAAFEFSSFTSSGKLQLSTPPPPPPFHHLPGLPLSHHMSLSYNITRLWPQVSDFGLEILGKVLLVT